MNKPLKTTATGPQQSVVREENWHEEDWFDGLLLVQGDLEALASLLLMTCENMEPVMTSQGAKILHFLVSRLHGANAELEKLIEQKK